MSGLLRDEGGEESGLASEAVDDDLFVFGDLRGGGDRLGVLVAYFESVGV